MSFATYLRSHALRTVSAITLLLALGCLLPPLGVTRDGILLFLILAAILEATPFLWEWVRSLRFARNLEQLSAEGEDALAYSRTIEEPAYPEGELSWQAIQNLARAAEAESHKTQADAEEYRQYVETWVHEVKTPLAAARLMLADSQNLDASALAHEIARIDAYVEQALFYARSTSVENDYLIRAIPAEELVKDAIRSRARTLIEAHMGVSLSGLMQEGHSSPVLFCDPKWMDFILGQLIDNAVRYRALPELDGRQAQLSFTARIEDAGTAHERAVLAVRDNGCGISEADLPRIFERGFTGENGRSHAKATGMGLYLARTLCQKMGLSISARSKEGEGTTFEIVFPRERSRMVA